MLVRRYLRFEMTLIAMLDIEMAKAALKGVHDGGYRGISTLIRVREQRVRAARLQADLLSQFLQELAEHYRSVKAIGKMRL